MALFPLGSGYATAKQSKKHYQLVSESINGRMQVRSLGASRRQWVLKWPPMTRAAFDPIYTFLETLNGSENTFTINLPNPLEPTTDQVVTCRLMGEVQEFDIGVDNFVTFEIDIVEVL